MDFVKDLEHDEMRDGFLVKSDRKKLWNVELGCYNEFRRICEKYNLRFFADHGTLLGAVRHRGFVPWDDDMDFAMLRPDYERFKEVARNEIKYPYFLSIWYENEGIEDWAGDTTFGTFMRIHDERTTAIYLGMKNPTHQGICIDIFPLDSCPNLRKPQNIVFDKYMQQWQILIELQRTALTRDLILKMLSDRNAKTFIPKDQLIQFAMIPLKDKGKILEKYCLKFFDEASEYFTAGLLPSYCISAKPFRDWIELPFENTSVPCPVDYKDVLNEEYDNWREFECTGIHTKIYSTDISYKEFLKMRDDRLN